MGRELKEFLPFITDAANRFYVATYNNFGVPTVTTQPLPYPILNSPKDFDKFQPKFGTNSTYFSGVRSVTNTFEFIKDGADICRYIYYNGVGYAAEAYFTVLRYDKNDGVYKLYYKGRLDFKKGKDNPLQSFSLPCVDNSVWGILSQNDTSDYNIPCNAQNPLAVPVLLDGITLRAKYTYQPIAQEFDVNGVIGFGTSFIIPFVLVNTDGDSSGIISQDQTYYSFSSSISTYLTDNQNVFFQKTVKPATIVIKGVYIFQFKNVSAISGTVQFSFYLTTNFGQNILVQTISALNSTTYHTYTIAINKTIVLQTGERIVFWCDSPAQSAGWKFFPLLNNIYSTLDSKADASVAYSLRPLDLFQALVTKATDGNYTCNSNLFTANDTLVTTVGNAIRNSANASILTNFRNAFKSYDTEFWLAFRVILGEIWIEKAEVVYDDTTNLFSLGQISDLELMVAEEYLFNTIEADSPKQDYRHTSGRLEFNSTNKFSVQQFNIKKALDLISPFRKDGYGVEFLRLDYQQESTHDNAGDDSAFLLDIVNQKDTEGVPVENFVQVEVNSTPLAPIIYTPVDNDTVANSLPTVTGVAPVGATVNVYVDGVLDGSAIANAQTNWSYNITTPLDPYVAGVNDGAHTIEVTFTDLSGTVNNVTIVVVSSIQPISIEYPINGSNLYNNKPLIKGFSPAGLGVPVLIDGALIGTPVADGSGRWKIQSPVLSNGSHTIDVAGELSVINVNSFVAIPLITSFNEGLQIVNNLPLIEGVATPGTTVYIWLNYYPDFPAGSTVTDSFGNWSFQLVPIFKTGGSINLAPLDNGLNIISTSLDILSTIINITGYKLNRPAYSSMTGVIDNTVFNTELTPMHSLIKRMKFFKSVFYQQPNTVIEFQGGDKNTGFSTTLAGKTVKENDDLKLSSYSTPALFIPIILSFKCKTPILFNSLIDNFSAGGLVEMDYYGYKIYCLPIGEMTVQDIKNDVQTWKLLLSAKTPLLTLLRLSTPGSTFNTMADNTIFRSDYNTLHFVKYGFTISPKYKTAEMYEDWFENRNEQWVNNPKYIQKIQTTEPFIDELITKNVSGSLQLNMYRCSDAKLITTFAYSVVSPAPIPLPEVVWHCPLNLSPYSGNDYFFVLFNNGNPICISERLRVEDSQDNTILIEAWDSANKTGAMFSTGFKSIIRVEGLIEKFQPSNEIITNEDEVGNFAMLHSVNTRKRTILFGDPRGLPDYLYLKIAAALTLDNLYINGVRYVLSKDAKLEPIEKIEGYPMYFYSVEVELFENPNGVTFETPTGNIVGGVTLVVDAGAFGLGGGGLIEIDLN